MALFCGCRFNFRHLVRTYGFRRYCADGLLSKAGLLDEDGVGLQDGRLSVLYRFLPSSFVITRVRWALIGRIAKCPVVSRDYGILSGSEFGGFRLSAMTCRWCHTGGL